MKEAVGQSILVLDCSAFAHQTPGCSSNESMERSVLQSSIWSYMVQSVCEYARVVFDLFHNEYQLSVIVNGQSAVVLNSWESDNQTLAKVMQELSKITTSQSVQPYAHTIQLEKQVLSMGIQLAVDLLTSDLNENERNCSADSGLARIVVLRAIRKECFENARDEGNINSFHFAVVSQQNGKGTEESPSQIAESGGGSQGVTQSGDIRVILMRTMKEYAKRDRRILDLVKNCELCVLNFIPGTSPELLSYPNCAESKYDCTVVGERGQTQFVGLKRLSPTVSACAYTIPCEKSKSMISRIVRLHYNVHTMLICGIPMKESASSAVKNKYNVEMLWIGHISSHIDTPLDYLQETMLYASDKEDDDHILRVKWPQSGKHHASASVDHLPPVSAHRVTPVDVTDPAAQVIMKHVLSGKNVGLAIASDRAAARASYALCCDTGTVFLHRLAGPPSTVGIPATSVEYGSRRYPSQRIKEFHALIDDMKVNGVHTLPKEVPTRSVLHTCIDHNKDVPSEKEIRSHDLSVPKIRYQRGTLRDNELDAVTKAGGGERMLSRNSRACYYRTLVNVEHRTRGFPLSYEQSAVFKPPNAKDINHDLMDQLLSAMSKMSMTETELKSAAEYIRSLNESHPPLPKPMQQTQTGNGSLCGRPSTPPATTSLWNDLNAYARLFYGSSKGHALLSDMIQQYIDSAIGEVVIPETSTEGQVPVESKQEWKLKLEKFSDGSAETKASMLKHRGSSNVPIQDSYNAESNLLGVWTSMLTKSSARDFSGRDAGSGGLYGGHNSPVRRNGGPTSRTGHKRSRDEERQSQRRPYRGDSSGASISSVSLAKGTSEPGVNIWRGINGDNAAQYKSVNDNFDGRLKPDGDSSLRRKKNP
eukprot:CFRG2502T1